MPSNRKATYPGFIKHNRLFLKALCALLVAAFVSTLQAATFTVTSSADSGPGSLREAVGLANDSEGTNDTIVFADGVTSITLTSGQLTVTDNLRVVGFDVGVVISGNGASRIFGVTEPDKTLELVNLVLRDGKQQDDNGADECQPDWGSGGAVCAFGPFALRNSRVLDSDADSEGGAVFVNTSGPVVFENCALINNTGQAGGGGARVIAGQLEIDNCEISGNQTDQLNGHGGGVSATAASITIGSSTFANNRTTGVGADAGALWVDGDTGLRQSTISGNQVLGASESSEAGAIYSRGGDLLLNSVTITDNSSTFGGAVTFFDAGSRQFSVRNTILTGNTAPEGNLLANAALVDLTVSFSLFGDGPGEIGATNINNLFLDAPQLAALADNGCAVNAGISGPGVTPPAGCVRTRLPLAGSPVIDAGDNGVDAFDQRGTGFPRLAGGQVDMGAVEASASVNQANQPLAVPVDSPFGLLALSLLMLWLGWTQTRLRA